MVNTQKTLLVKYAPELDLLPLPELAHFLEVHTKAHSIDQNNWSETYFYKPITRFYIARGDAEIYVSFDVKGNLLRALFSEDQQPVHRDSCVSALFYNEQTKRSYEFSFNCIGTCFAAAQDEQGVMVPLDLKESAQIRRWSSIGKRPFNELHGMFSWSVTAAIPFSFLGEVNAETLNLLTANFCKRADASSLPHYLSWNPIQSEEPNFNLPDFFGVLAFD